MMYRYIFNFVCSFLGKRNLTHEQKEDIISLEREKVKIMKKFVNIYENYQQKNLEIKQQELILRSKTVHLLEEFVSDNKKHQEDSLSLSPIIKFTDH